MKMNWITYNYLRGMKLSRAYCYRVSMTNSSFGLLPRAVKFIKTLKNITTC